MEDFDGNSFVYEENVMGVPSGLQPGDNLIAIEGTMIDRSSVSSLWSLKPVWTAGNSVRYTVLRDGQLWLRGLVGQPDGSEIIAGEIHGAPEAAEQLGQQLAEDLLARGAGRILAAVYGNA